MRTMTNCPGFCLRAMRGASMTNRLIPGARNSACKILNKGASATGFNNGLDDGFLNHLADALEGPVNLLALDDQRRRDPNHPVVGFFAQDSFFLQRFAVGPRRTVQLDSDPQALAADFLQIGAMERLQQPDKVSAEFSRTFDQLLLGQHPQCGAGYGAAQGIA